MSTILRVNIDDLLHCRTVESERIEFKASWDPETTGPQVLRTICAFANDHHNLNGGYIVLGVAEREGRTVLPPQGLSESDLEAAQRWIRGNCNRLDPPYMPILSPEFRDGRLILVVWAPASEMRPHREPGTKANRSPRFWLRIGSETVDAEQRGPLLHQFLQQTTRTPWDDRRASEAQLDDLRYSAVREYLHEVGSGLLDEPDERKIYRHMGISTKVNGYEIPKNVGLILFSDDPTKWFRGAKLEVVSFTEGRAENIFEERIFNGSIFDQIRNCLRYLEAFLMSCLKKQDNDIYTKRWENYPTTALRETLVNALYHRSYDIDQPELTKLYIYRDRIEITSYPGPVPGIELSHLVPGTSVPAAPARNRRIGEFLKELRLAEGRLTGLPKIFQAMEDNGSPPPKFEFDEQRTYFQAVLPAHPEYRYRST